MKYANHPVPVGWRRLEDGEKVSEGDIMNDLNHSDYYPSGFISSSMLVGLTVTDNFLVAVYRKVDTDELEAVNQYADTYYA